MGETQELTNPDRTFTTADDGYLARLVGEASDRLVFIAPGLGKATAGALIDAIGPRGIATTIILDADADACRIGYGDPEALESLHAAVTQFGFAVRREAGLRIGLLITDRTVVIWSPTPRAVEAERVDGQANAIVLSGAPVETLANAAGAGHDGVPPLEAEIGRQALKPADLAATVEDLRKNPRAPFDLARRTRVFSTRFQFVEFELQGAEWTDRGMKVSSFLLNADLSEGLQDVLETQIRPFQATGDVEIDVPLLVRGKPAYERDGSRMLAPATQAQVLAVWTETKRRYLNHVKGFGWLIRREQLKTFRAEATAFEEMLSAWVEGFRAHVLIRQDALIAEVASAIGSRIQRASQRSGLEQLDLEHEVRRGFERLRVIEPRVRIILKDVAWESSRDEEFMTALKQAIPKKDLEGWFEEFTVARERSADTPLFD